MRLLLTGIESLWVRWGEWVEGLIAGILTFALVRNFGLHEMIRGIERTGIEGLPFAIVVAFVVVALRRSGNIESAIAERDRALKAFRGSQDLYRHIVENAREMIFEVDMGGRITFVNKASERFMEYPVSEILGRKYLDFVLDSHKDTIHRSFVLQAARNISVQYTEGPTRSKSGKIIWFGQHVHLKRDGDKPAGFQVISRDVTERRAAEEQLRNSEKKIRATFDQAPIGMALVDKTGRLLEANWTLAEMLGYSQQELLKKRFPEITHNEDILKDVGNFHDLLEGQSQSYQMEKRYIKKNGEVFWGRLTVSRLNDKESAAAFAIGMVENIDNWKRSEESNRRLQSVVEETTDIVATASPSGRLLSLNKAGRAILGIGEAEDIRGITPREFYSEDTVNQLKTTVRSTIVQTGRWKGSAVLRSRSGREIHVSQIILGHTNDEGKLTYFSTIARDMTKEVESQAALDKERMLLRTVVEAIPDEVVVKDRERRFVLANAAAVRALQKKSAEEVIGLRDEELIPPGFAVLAKDQEEQVFRTGEPIINNYGKNKIDPVTGTILRGILMTKVPLRNKEGEITNVVVVNRDVTEIRRVEAEKENLIAELKNALAEVRTLSGLLPICASCKKIRDDGGYWNKIESYVETHTSAQFSHGLCPDCMGDYFPEAVRRRKDSADPASPAKEPKS